MRTIIATTAAATLAAAVVGSASAAPTMRHAVCGQIKNGPYADYTSVLGHHLKGRTWTVFVNGGIPCTVAMKSAPTVLKWWKANNGGGATLIPGFACSRDQDRGYSGTGTSSGGAGCLADAGRYGPNANFTIRMTGPYTLAQLKSLYGG
jgi:hypothetical protein